MKKSGFIALILGTVSGVLFALGMCMALLPEWDAFTEGVLFGVSGLLLGLIAFFVWCKMENKKLPELKGKNLLLIAFGVLGVLILGSRHVFVSCMGADCLGNADRTSWNHPVDFVDSFGKRH